MIFLPHYSVIQRLILSQSAKTDLANIAEYTMKKWGRQQKDHYLSFIKKSFLTLQRSENDDFQRVMGRYRPDIADGLFSYSISKHTVYYRKNTQAFTIVRVLHNHMESSRHLP